MNQEGAPESQANLKTKVRRLYDITNVLMSLGVVRKIRLNGRQEFEWVGSKDNTEPAQWSPEPRHHRAKGRSPSFFCELFLRESTPNLQPSMNNFVERWSSSMWETIDSQRENRTLPSMSGLGGLVNSESLR